jgi:hypothetical protein
MGVLNYFLLPILLTTAFGVIATCCSSRVKKSDEDMQEKKIGPIVVRTKTKKRKEITDVENPELEVKVQKGKEEVPTVADPDPENVEMKITNPAKAEPAAPEVYYTPTATA